MNIFALSFTLDVADDEFISDLVIWLVVTALEERISKLDCVVCPIGFGGGIGGAVEMIFD